MWHSFNICDVTTVQLSNGTVHKFVQNFYFSWKCIFPLLLYLGMLGLRWMCMHLWMNLIKRTTDIQENLKIVKIYVQSQWRVVLLWYHIFCRVPSREGDIHNFAYSLLLNGLSKSAQTFTVGFVKLLSTHPIHIVVWGNFPFNEPTAGIQITLLSKCQIWYRY